jgi:hypothetical protein
MNAPTVPPFLAAKIDKDDGCGMRCPKCDYATRVVDSRQGSANSIRRRRMCLSSACQHRVTTYECIYTEGAPIDEAQLSRLMVAIAGAADELRARIQAINSALAAAATLSELRRK